MSCAVSVCPAPDFLSIDMGGQKSTWSKCHRAPSSICICGEVVGLEKHPTALWCFSSLSGCSLEVWKHCTFWWVLSAASNASLQTGSKDGCLWFSLSKLTLGIHNSRAPCVQRRFSQFTLILFLANVAGCHEQLARCEHVAFQRFLKFQTLCQAVRCCEN